MLFERELLTAQGKAEVLTRLFAEAATRNESPTASGGTVPREVLDAYGELASHVRFIMEAATHVAPNREIQKQIRKIEKLLDSLPESILQSLSAGPCDNWMQLYRKLVQLHVQLEESFPTPDADEYTAIVQKICNLAKTVADHAVVQINAGSMFCLLMMQVHLHRYSKPARKRRTKKKATKRTAKPKQ